MVELSRRPIQKIGDFALRKHAGQTRRFGRSAHLLCRVDEQHAGPEGQQTAWVITTNFYVKTGQGWRLASHHASPGSLQTPSAGTSAKPGEWPNTLH